MKTVIQVVQHLRPGGLETVALDLFDCHSSHERCFIISLEGTRREAIHHWPRLAKLADRIIFMDKQPGLEPQLIRSLRKLFIDLGADVVHSHHIGPLLYAGLAARLAGVKRLIHTEHDAWHLDNPKRRWLERALLTLTRPALVADANSVASSLKKHLHLKSVKVVSNGIDTERFIPGDQPQARLKMGLPLAAKIIGCSGRLERVKGQRVLITALSKLPVEVHLALAGTGSTEAALRRLTTRLNLDQRVHFLGQVDDMPTFYQALDLFSLPSLREGYPLAPLEAQACSIPSMVTDVGGAAETLCPFTGSLVPAGDPMAIAKTLSRMLGRVPRISPRSFVQRQADLHSMAQAYAQLH